MAISIINKVKEKTPIAAPVGYRTSAMGATLGITPVAYLDTVDAGSILYGLSISSTNAPNPNTLSANESWISFPGGSQSDYQTNSELRSDQVYNVPTNIQLGNTNAEGVKVRGDYSDGMVIFQQQGATSTQSTNNSYFNNQTMTRYQFRGTNVESMGYMRYYPPNGAEFQANSNVQESTHGPFRSIARNDSDSANTQYMAVGYASGYVWNDSNSYLSTGVLTGTVWAMAYKTDTATLLAADSSGIIAKSTNNGGTWTDITPAGLRVTTNDYCRMMYIRKTGKFYLSNNEGDLLVSDDDGTTWSYAFDHENAPTGWNTSAGSSGFHVRGEKIVFTNTAGQVVTSTNGGQSWRLSVNDPNTEGWSGHNPKSPIYIEPDSNTIVTVTNNNSTPLVFSPDFGSKWISFGFGNGSTDQRVTALGNSFISNTWGAEIFGYTTENIARAPLTWRWRSTTTNHTWYAHGGPSGTTSNYVDDQWSNNAGIVGGNIWGASSIGPQYSFGIKGGV